MPLALRKKRVDPGIDPNNVIDGPRKRARRSTEAANRFGQSNSKSRSQPQRHTLQLKVQVRENSIAGGNSTNPVAFEQGIKIWIAVMQATDPTGGRPLAVDFLELPSKKSWPNYYVLIRDPISLQEIKNKLDHGSYPTTQAVKRDFDKMCNNAKQFSVSGSSTWADADNLQKLVQQAFKTVTGEPAETKVDQTAPIADREESSISKAPKTHLPVLGKPLKMRLQKLYEMKDAKGRRLCGVFMISPSPRLHPSYYILIKNIMAFNMIEAKLDIEGYDSLQQFINDVELIWSNAYTTTTEGSPIWEDTKVLQEAFRNLMSDLPALCTFLDIETGMDHEVKTTLTPHELTESPLALDTTSSGGISDVPARKNSNTARFQPTQEEAGTLDPHAETSLASLVDSISSVAVSINGHFGDVFAGTHRTIGKIALKRPRISETGYEESVIRRFEREAVTWQRLRHRHILEFIGTLKRDGHVYLVSPFIDKGTLMEYVLREPRANRVRLLRETADAVNYLHTEGVIHGDIKAGNILIGRDGSALLCDFGLTRMTDARTSTCMKGAGSMRWMSPDLWDNASRSFQSDVYAFGMTIAEVLSGNEPFPHLLTMAAVMMAVMAEGKRPGKEPLSSPDGLSYETAWQVAEACWQTSPSDRISMSEAFRRLSEDPSAGRTPDSGAR